MTCFARTDAPAAAMDAGSSQQSRAPSRAAFVTQAGALLRKNLRYQRSNW